ncbi:MAG TPA: hypothetical protein VHX61_08190 [Rhizomicrobium sp.]|jgi:hypothetical protein|nr:hypothetical protein [Rhizomicrobium sp.]
MSGLRQTGRRYEKGERRYKHVGKTAAPEIRFFPDDPKRWEGLCPNSLTSADHLTLLNEAITGSNGDREIPFPKSLWTVHNGAIYKADTTDRGKSYHGYPYRGKLARGLMDRLREMAVAKGCERQFDDWVKQHITMHGSW